MVLRLYLFSLYSAFFLTTGLIAIIIFNINPFSLNFLMIILFYFLVFIFLASLFGLINFYIKVWASNREVIFAHLIPSLRQSVLISLSLVIMLFLQQLKVLNWWVAILVIVAFAFFELYFRREKYAG